MRGRITRLATMALMAAVSIAGLAQPASALPAGAGAFDGQGALEPGYSTVAAAQSWTFSTIVAVGATTAPNAGLYSCSFVVDTDPGTLISDTAVGTMSCAGTVSINCTFGWTRVGAVVVFDGPCDDGGQIAGAFAFVFTSLQPSTSYVLAGAMAFT